MTNTVNNCVGPQRGRTVRRESNPHVCGKSSRNLPEAALNCSRRNEGVFNVAGNMD